MQRLLLEFLSRWTWCFFLPFCNGRLLPLYAFALFLKNPIIYRYDMLEDNDNTNKCRDYKGFCSHHGNKVDNPVLFIPEALVERSSKIFQHLLSNMVEQFNHSFRWFAQWRICKYNCPVTATRRRIVLHLALLQVTRLYARWYACVYLLSWHDLFLEIN